MKLDENDVKQIWIGVIIFVIGTSLMAGISYFVEYNKKLLEGKKSANPIQNTPGNTFVYNSLIKGEVRGRKTNLTNERRTLFASTNHTEAANTNDFRSAIPAMGSAKISSHSNASINSPSNMNAPAMGLTNKEVATQNSTLMTLDSIFFYNPNLIKSAYPLNDIPVVFPCSNYFIYKHYVYNHGGIVFWTNCQNCDWSVSINGEDFLRFFTAYEIMPEPIPPDLIFETLVSGKKNHFVIKDRNNNVYGPWEFVVKPNETLIYKISEMTADNK